MLYAAVFVGRYLDLFRADGWDNFYLVFYIILLMMKVYPRTREQEKAWKLGLWSLGGSFVLAPIITLLDFGGFPSHWFTEVSRKHYGPAFTCS